jgi:anti-anti-sigma factor
MAAISRSEASTEPPFRCFASISDVGHATVLLQGDLDLANASLLRTELLATLEKGIDHLAVDLSSLTFLDSAGIGVLVVVRKVALERGVVMELESVPTQARQTLEKCGLGEMFDL